MHILGTTFFFILSLKVCLGLYLQTSEVQAYVGESVILPCNGSGFSVEELYVHWEAMGKDVISLQGENISVGRGFEDRVNFLQDPAESEDFTIILSDVMLNDGEIYECLWEGTKPISSVLLQVLTPAVFTDHVKVFEGDDITLDCFGNIPKKKPWEDIYLQWLKDDREILRLSSGEMDVSIDHSVLRLPDKHDLSRGIFSLSIQSVSAFDRGVYQCRYKSTDYEAPRSGFPETHTLTVWVTETSTDPALSLVTHTVTRSVTTDPSVTETHTEFAVSSEAWSSASLSQTQTSSIEPVWTQTESSSSLPTLTYAERHGALSLVTHTVTRAVTTGPSVTETHTEFAPLLATDTSVTEADTDSGHSVTADESVSETDTDSALLVMTDPSAPETGTVSGQKGSQEEIPWIRIALISGVLLVTAGVLGLLLVFGRI